MNTFDAELVFARCLDGRIFHRLGTYYSTQRADPTWMRLLLEALTLRDDNHRWHPTRVADNSREGIGCLTISDGCSPSLPPLSERGGQHLDHSDTILWGGWRERPDSFLLDIDGAESSAF